MPRLRWPALWQNHTYLTLWGGKLVSATGSGMSQVAFPLLILALTRSAAIAGLAGALRMLPYLVLSLPAGALVDRWDRRRVMLICDSGRALALGSMPLALLLGHLSMAQIFVVALVEGSLFVFFDVAETAALPSIVTPEEMPAATAQYLSLTDGVTNLLGPALGGALFAAGRMVPFLSDAISYAVSVGALARVRLPQQAQSAAPRSRLNAHSLWHDIAAGMAWLWRQPCLRSLMVFLGLSNLFCAGEALVVIELASRLHATAAQTGLVLAMGGGGAVAGALLAERVAGRLPFKKAFVVSFWLVALVWIMYALAPTPLLLGLVMAASGSTLTIVNVVQFSYRMTLIPAELQGRITSTMRLVIYGTVPLGLVVTGLLIQRCGAIVAVLVLGVALLALAAGVTVHPLFRPDWRRPFVMKLRLALAVLRQRLAIAQW